ncbi:MAG: C4-type zinc ribbon domain-containing protein [bacterium]|nr:C4-type zinc ribbon domain-containing protein [bacterium]
MNTSLNQLIELQKIDTQIISLRTKLDELPKKLNEQKQALNTLIAKCDAARQTFEQLSKDRHTCEMNLKEDEENVKKFSVQLYAVKTNEQYNALKHEIALAKEKISKTEDKILELMDKIDNIKRVWDEEKKKVEEGKQRFAEEEKKIHREEAELKEQIARYETERATLANNIEPSLLNVYQRISKRYNGLALVSIKGDVCQGCFLRLPPQVVNEVKKNERIIKCENCARILYWNEEDNVVQK